MKEDAVKLIKVHNKHDSYYGVYSDVTDYYCPKCGTKDVYVEFGDGDYYNGPDFICKSCKAVFCLPAGVSVDDSIIFGGPLTD